MLKVRWARLPNWGDAINPILIEKLSGQTPVLVNEN